MKKFFTTFLFAYSLAATAQTIEVSKGASRPIAHHFAGVNGNAGTINMPWNNPQLLAGFVRTGANSIRYPAGTIANTWDWDRGWIDPTVPDSLLINWVVSERWKEANVRYPIEHFAVAIKASGAEPVYVLNMLSKDLEHSLRGLRRAKAAGLPVRYIEMGNELYFNLKLETARFPTPEDYGKTCYQWIAAIKKEFPEAKCAVVSWEQVRGERHKQWTERVLQYATNADAVIFHVYTPFGIDGARERTNNQAGQEGLTETSPLSKDPAERQRQELALLNDPTAYNRMLLTGFSVAERHKHMRVPADKEIWATEFNVRSDSSAIRGTWANTLFVSTFYVSYLQNPQIVLTHLHNIQGPIFGAIFSNENGLRHLRNERIKTTPSTLTAGGLALHFFAALTRNGGTLTSLQFANNPTLLPNNAQSFPALHGWLVNSGKKTKGLLINYSAQPQTISGKPLLKGLRYISYSAPLQHYVLDVEGLTKSKGKADQTIILPPFSITVLEQ